MDVCRSVIENVKMYLDADLPDAEIYYLYQYLTSSRIESGLSTPVEIPEEVSSAT